MNKNMIAGLVVVLAVGVSAAAWVALPELQEDTRAVDREVSWQTERARRLLHEYSVVLDYDGMLVEQLDEVGLDVDPDNLTDEIADEYQTIQEPLWEAYPPMNFRAGSVSPALPNYGNIDRDIREGLRQQQQNAQDNARLLDDALAAVNVALSVTRGSADARSDTEANRLKGIILYYQGVAKRIRAKLYRSDANELRGELAALVGRAADAEARTADGSVEAVDDRVSEQRTMAHRVETTLGEDRAALAVLKDRIADIERRLAEATGRLDAARRDMDELRTTGANLADPGGAELFAERFGQAGRAFRAAAREAYFLEFGGIPKARLEPPGDYLAGRFVEGASPADVTPEFGLVHYRDQQVVLEGQVKGREIEFEGINADVARLDAGKDALYEQQKRAEDELKRIGKSASERYDELSRLDAEAFALEDQAIQLFEQSARASRTSARGADDWVSRARAATRQLASENKERSAFDTRTRDAWMAGYIAAQEADARLAAATIQYDRFHSYIADADVLGRIAAYVTLPEVDVEAERTKAENARIAGIEAVTDAMSMLESAHKRTERQWTLTAQAAAATYLLSMFGREDYVPDAIEAYRKAVNGRETEASAQPFMARLNRLESR